MLDPGEENSGFNKNRICLVIMQPEDLGTKIHSWGSSFTMPPVSQAPTIHFAPPSSAHPQAYSIVARWTSQLRSHKQEGRKEEQQGTWWLSRQVHQIPSRRVLGAAPISFPSHLIDHSCLQGSWEIRILLLGQG